LDLSSKRIIGGSGGARALAVTDRLLMLENAVYFVAALEFCASLVWRDPNQKRLAAGVLRISASEIAAMGCADEIVPEPAGGAHTNRERSFELLNVALKRILADLKARPLSVLIELRQQKFRNSAQFYAEG
jgi:acetyl-CoA carboxylase carboxyl transferase subunit alpha